MHAALRLKMTVGVLATYQKSDGLNPDFFALLNIHRLRFVTASLNPALVHAQKHVGPVARFGSAGAGMNRHKRVRGIVFAGKKLAQLELLESMNQPLALSRDFLF